MSSLSFKNKLLTLALKKYAITEIKVFRSCLTLLDFLIFLIYFAPIVVNVKKWKLQEICRKLQIYSHLLKKTIMENFIPCAVLSNILALYFQQNGARNEVYG